MTTLHQHLTVHDAWEEAWQRHCARGEEILEEAGEEAQGMYNAASEVGIDMHDTDAIVILYAEGEMEETPDEPGYEDDL